MKSDAAIGDGSAPDLPGETPPAEPMRFGDYLLEREIAHGGMGVVYQGRQAGLGRVVAVKLLLLGRYSSAESVERFKREAQAAAALRHPNIVAIHEVGEYDGQHYFSMEFVDGRSLADLLREGPIEPRRAAEIAQAVAGAIHYAHEQAVLHRDLKPSNVLIDALGRVRVTDFGLAKKLDGSSDLTVTGQMMGTPNYLSPEQAAGRNAELGPASDVYAIGAVLYELLTGRPPFLANSLQDTLLRIRDFEPVNPRALNPAVPRDLETICLKCLRKEPARRYATAQALADDLGRWLQQLPIEARPIRSAERVGLWCRRSPLQALLLAALMLALAGGFAGVLSQWWRAEKLRKQAEASRATAEAARREAETQAMDVRRRAYASDIQLAQRALAEGNIGRARDLLQRQRPAAGEVDLRGWEWRYLQQQCRSDALFTLASNQGAIAGLTSSSDGRWLAVVSEGGARLALWDLPARREAATVADGASHILAAFSPSAPLMAFAAVRERAGGGSECEACLWSPLQREAVRCWKLPGTCYGLAFSADGQRLVTTTPGEVSVWGVSNGVLLASHPLSGHSKDVTGPFAASRNLQCVAVGINSTSIKVINPESGKLLATISTNDMAVSGLAISPDNAILAVAYFGADPCVTLYELPGGREMRRLDFDNGYARELAFTDDGRTLLSACSDQAIRRWTLPGFEAAGVLRGHTYEVSCLALLPDGQRLASGSGDGQVLVWEAAASRNERGRCRLSVPGCLFWRFTPDSQAIILGSRDRQVIRRSGPAFEQSQTLLDLGTNLYAALVSDDCRWVAASDTKGKLRLWDLGNQTLRREVLTGGSNVVIWAFADNGNRVLIVDRNDQSLHEWDVVSGTIVDPSPNLTGWRVHEGFRQGNLCREAGREVLRRWGKVGPYPTNELTHVFTGAFTADERLFASDAGNGRLSVEEVSTGRQIVLMRAVLQGLHSVAFSGDGLLAVGSDRREAVKLWRLDNFQELLTLSAPGAIFGQTHFSPDGNQLGSLDQEGDLFIWRAPIWEELAETESPTRAD